MRRFVRWSFLALLTCAALAGGASATTYYIAANGSDSNNGTAKTTPWLHAPGMTGCTGTCNSTTPQPGDSFILRGGDTWHTSTGSPVGLPWNWNWSGSSGNSIYIGVDTSWSAAGSWTRPVFTMDNPLSTARPSSCRFDDTNTNGINIGSQNNVTIDNFEFTGKCWSGNPNTAETLGVAGNNNTVSNCYFHGWTYASSSSVDEHVMIGGGLPNGNYMLITKNVFDGSDSSLGMTPNQASGFAILNTGSEISFNVFNHVSNGMINEANNVHDNLFENMFEPQGSVHGNIYELNGPAGTIGNVFFYNNLMQNTNEGEGVDINLKGGNAYIFNNVSQRYRQNSDGSNGSDGTNCYMLEGPGLSGSAVQAYFYNNTSDSPCGLVTEGVHSGQEWNGTVNLENNHFIGFSSQSLASAYSIGDSTHTTIVDNGHEVFQSEAAANAQGYVAGNNYAPTSSNDATVAAGASLASWCSGLSASSASSACKSGIAGVAYDSNTHAAVPGSSVARSASGWDAGAYQFSSSSTSTLKPPTGLSAVVQ